MWGNQTMVEFDLDGSLRHTSWTKKVDGSLEHKGLKASELKMNQEVVLHPAWNKDLILARTKWMAETLALITSAKAVQNEQVIVDKFSGS